MVEAYLFSKADGKWALREAGKMRPFAIVVDEKTAKCIEWLWNRHEEYQHALAANMEALERKPKQ